MRVVWTGRAVSDLGALRTYIARDNERAADDMVVHIVNRTERQLSALPKSGRPGRIPETRELVLTGTPFILPYRIVGDAVDNERAATELVKAQTSPTSW